MNLHQKQKTKKNWTEYKWVDVKLRKVGQTFRDVNRGVYKVYRVKKDEGTRKLILRQFIEI